MDQSNHRHGFYLQVIIILLGLGVLRLWMMPVDVLPVASAQLPDSGAQRRRQIVIAERANEILGRIDDQLRNGTLRVDVQDGESTKASDKRRGPS